MATTNVCMYTPELGDNGAAGRLAVPSPGQVLAAELRRGKLAPTVAATVRMLPSTRGGRSEMTAHLGTDGSPLVVHVIPSPLGRGAQRAARILVDRLDEPGVVRHRLLGLFDGPPEVELDWPSAFQVAATPPRASNRASPSVYGRRSHVWTRRWWWPMAATR